MPEYNAIRNSQRQHLGVRCAAEVNALLTPGRRFTWGGDICLATCQDAKGARPMARVVEQEHAVVWILGAASVGVTLDEVPLQVTQQVFGYHLVLGIVAGVHMRDANTRHSKIYCVTRLTVLGVVIAQVPGELVGPDLLPVIAVLGRFRTVAAGGEELVGWHLIWTGVDRMNEIRLGEDDI